MVLYNLYSIETLHCNYTIFSHNFMCGVLKILCQLFLILLHFFTILAKMLFLLSAAVRRNPSTTGATDADVQQQLLRFMHGSQDREGGRTARQKKRKVLVQQAAAAGIESDSD